MKRNHAVMVALAAGALAIFAYFATSTAKPTSFRADLSGQTALPPVKTLAQGQATFQLNRAGDKLSFTLTVSNIENVTVAHLHVGSKTDSLGQLLVTLYKGPVRPGRTDGTLAKGTIKSSDLKGALTDQPLSKLIAIFAEGLIYVDVHTEQVPTGEIRGQLQ